MRISHSLNIIGLVILTIAESSTYALPSTPPAGSSGYTGGIFAHYFQNIIEGNSLVGWTSSGGACPSGKAITGYSMLADGTYGLPICGTITSPQYWTSTDAGANIYFTGAGNIAIGKETAGALLDVNGDILVNDITVGRGGGAVVGNTANGFGALQSNTTGFWNTANGFLSLSSNTTGLGNTSNGYRSLASNSTGVTNTAYGFYTLQANTIGVQNTAVGANALNDNTTGNNNTANGQSSLQFNSIGNNNTANGVMALYANNIGNDNIGMGRWAGFSNTTGNYNTTHGSFSLYQNNGGSNNTAIGYFAGSNLTSGDNNIAIGANTDLPSTTASNQLNIGNWIYGDGGNIGIGTTTPKQKLDVNGDMYVSNIPGSGSNMFTTVIGTNALPNTSNAGFSVAYGVTSLSKNTSGSDNSAIGVSALRDNTTGSYNTALGSAAGVQNTTGDYNTAVGQWALFGNTTGSNNTTLGKSAGSNITTGSSNIAIGSSSSVASATGSNQLSIGNWIYGDGGNIGIGTGTALTAKLTVAGTIQITGGTPGAGKVLTATNATGLASWVTPSSALSGGQTNYITRWLSATTVGTGTVYDDGTNVGIGTGTALTAKLTVAGAMQIIDGSQGSGKVLTSDANGVTSWVTPSTVNPNDCSATTDTVNGHVYSIIALVNGNNFVGNVATSISHGSVQYQQQFTCSAGLISTVGVESTQAYCDSGYAWDGANCALVATSGSSNCSASTQTVGAHTYTVAAINHNFSTTSTVTLPISNGTQTYNQIFQCSNATVSPYQTEWTTAVTCDSGYVWNGTSCVAGSADPAIIAAYSGTTCPTNSITVVNIAPGTDTIPATLNANSLYVLSAGAYPLSRSVTMNGCNAIVGAGTGSTEISFAGLSTNSTPLLVSTNRYASILRDFTISGTGSNGGRSQNNIRMVGSSGAIIDTLSSKNSTVGIYLENIKTSNVSKINSFSNTSYALQVQGTTIGSNYSQLRLYTSYEGLHIDTTGTAIYTDITSYNNSREGMWVRMSNSTFSNILIYNTSGYGNSSNGVSFYQTLNSTISNLQVYNNDGHGINLQGSDNCTLSNWQVYNNGLNGIVLQGLINTTISNLQTYNNVTHGIGGSWAISSTFSNIHSYSNSGAGIQWDTSSYSNAYSDISSYNNATYGILSTGPGNFYYDSLKVFGNISGGVSGTFSQGFTSHWLSGFSTGTLSTPTYSNPAWLTIPTNVTGWNSTKRGRQTTGVTFPVGTPVTYTYGANIALQKAPFISSACNLSTTSVTTCAPVIGGVSTYNSLNKIGQF